MNTGVMVAPGPHTVFAPQRTPPMAHYFLIIIITIISIIYQIKQLTFIKNLVRLYNVL